MMPLRLGLVLVGSTALVACGSHHRAAERSQPRPAAPPTIGVAHRTPLPAGVSRQFSFVGGAGPGPCFDVTQGAPRVHFYAQPFYSIPDRPSDNQRTDLGRTTFGQGVDVCFNGFGRGPVSVLMRDPTGRRVRGMLPRLPPADDIAGEGWAAFDWQPVIDPSWKLGRYMVIARSSAGVATTSFNVVPPTEPGLRVVGDSTDWGHNTVPPHAFTQLLLVGFRGAKTVRVNIYRGRVPSSQLPFLASTLIPIPPSGNVVVRIATPAASASVVYDVTTRADGVTLSSAFTVGKPSADPSVLTGALPTH